MVGNCPVEIINGFRCFPSKSTGKLSAKHWFQNPLVYTHRSVKLFKRALIVKIYTQDKKYLQVPQPINKQSPSKSVDNFGQVWNFVVVLNVNL